MSDPEKTSNSQVPDLVNRFQEVGVKITPEVQAFIINTHGYTDLANELLSYPVNDQFHLDGPARVKYIEDLGHIDNAVNYMMGKPYKPEDARQGIQLSITLASSKYLQYFFGGEKSPELYSSFKADVELLAGLLSDFDNKNPVHDKPEAEPTT